MNTYIALLRGINVGGRNPLPMKELISLMEHLGARNVATYIQSGNAVFVSAETNSSQLARRFGEEINRRHGFQPHVLVLRLAELEQAIATNPFADAGSDHSALHFGFLDFAPANPDLTKLDSASGRILSVFI